ncbi:MAG: hypothetical protein KDE26_11425 [Bacteroidetes bacterium]|nr:hypothetical protein [Bacteroidota bacterium]
MNGEMNDVQFQILDSIYFVESFANIVEEAGEPVPVVVDELRTMIDRGWIQVMMFDEEKNDFVRTSIYDTDHMEEYHYLATKTGLMKHNGRGNEERL